MAELLVAVAVVAVASSLVLAAVVRVRATAKSSACLAKLGQITTAFHLYTIDHSGQFPDPQAAGTTWEATLHTYLADPQVFLCPADGELGPAVGSSYDWRDTAVASTTLAGRSLMDVSRTDAVLTFEALPGWHDKHRMNVGRIDGSCGTSDEQAALGDLMKPIR